MLRLNPRIADLLGRHSSSISALAERAKISRSTIHALLNPAQHPERKGGMYPATAWKLANAFAEISGLTPEQAYHQLIIEEPSKQIT